jgi:hypothetical protein
MVKVELGQLFGDYFGIIPALPIHSLPIIHELSVGPLAVTVPRP